MLKQTFFLILIYIHVWTACHTTSLATRIKSAAICVIWNVGAPTTLGPTRKWGRQLIHFQGCIYRDLTRNEVRKRLIGQLSHLWTYEYIAAPVFGSESRDALWPRDWHPTQIHQIQDWRLLVRHSASCIFIGHHLPVTGSPANCWKALIASSNRLCGSPFSPRGSDFSSRR